MRYTGPKLKLCRREGVNLFGTEKYDLSTSNRKRLGGRGKASGYSVQLRAKQTAKRMYALTERQFSRYYDRAGRQSEMVTGDAMLRLLETRLDAIIFRSNFARTIMQARQFVTHAHFIVNGKKSSIPSAELKVGDVITIRERLKESPLYKSLATEFQEFIKKNQEGAISHAKWLSVDPSSLSITVKALPERADFDQSIDVQRIIEFYSK